MPSLILLVALTVVTAAYIYARNFRKLPTPPGPRGLPIIGNALQLPREHAWLAFSEWSKTYGSVMYLLAFGTPIVVLSSREAISDLLEKRSAIYSDRPLAPMAGELAGFRRYTAFMPYGHRHREGRKLIQGALHARKIPTLHAIQEANVAEFVSRLTQSPQDFLSHTRWLVAAVVLQITYGIAAGGSDDPFVSAIVEFMEDLSQITAPGAYYVDSFHFLKNIPECLPFASFKTRAREIREFLDRLEKKLYRLAQEQHERDDSASSFVADFLNEHENTPEEEKLCQQVATSFYGAGADTTISALLSFIWVMAQQPRVQRRAQEEVDATVGDRLPKCSDRGSMPYLDAVLKEVYRCNPVVPLALPHLEVLREDVYAGYRIPAGSTVFANSWAIFHDPSLYPLPNEVIPERYLNKVNDHVNPDPRDYAFGYGRRVCPGRMLAEDMLFIAAASLLACFDISRARPLNGDKVGYTGGIISHPEDFTCDIVPRQH